MKRTLKVISFGLAGLLGLAALSACAAPVASAQAAPAEAPHTISVTGEGIAYGAPDIAIAQIGVQSRNADPTTALGDANAKMTAVMAALKQLGVADKDIQTSAFSVSVQQDVDQQTGQPKGTLTYVVDNTVKITMRDLTKVGQVLGQVVAAGANNIYGVTFSVSDRSKLEADARDKAMADAKGRAAQLAQLAGVTLDKPMSITEISNSPIPLAQVNYSALGAAAARAVPVSTGQIEVDLQVNVTYIIQ
jgi:uncharacterized protein YggE